MRGKGSISQLRGGNPRRRFIQANPGENDDEVYLCVPFAKKEAETLRRGFGAGCAEGSFRLP